MTQAETPTGDTLAAWVGAGPCPGRTQLAASSRVACPLSLLDFLQEREEEGLAQGLGHKSPVPGPSLQREA